NVDSAIKVNGSNLVEKWFDQSNNKNHAIQNTNDNKPELIDSINKINNLPALSFDGNDPPSSDYFNFNDTSLSEFTVFTVYKLNPSPNGNSYILSDNDSLNGGVYAGGTGSLDGYGIIKLSPNNHIEANNMPLDQWVYTSFQNNNLFKNSIEANYEKRDSITSYIFGRIGRRGNNYSGKFSFKGYISEIIVYKKSLADSTRGLVEDYIANKYAPPVCLGKNIKIKDRFCDTSLSISSRFETVTWSNGKSKDTIKISSSGKYSAEVTDIFGSTSSDTIKVDYPKINYPTKTILCKNDTIIWKTGLADSIFNFTWQDSSTGSLIKITQPGDFYVTVKDSFGCSITSDTVTITMDSISNITSLGPDTSLCSGNKIGL
ncbi:MAG: hypothetical protein ABEH43_07005, partial [Flavobacteriales bacterium]